MPVQIHGKFMIHAEGVGALSLNALLMLALSRSLYMLRTLETRLVVLDLTPDTSLHEKQKILSEKLKLKRI